MTNDAANSDGNEALSALHPGGQPNGEARSERPQIAMDPQAFYDFTLDDFQLEACESLNAGRSVLVAAPTSSGKTVAAEHAIRIALAGGTRCFYTTPIKALSNQKFRDLRAIHGFDAVGLLTGDNSINGGAPIVVMTTEVLRNMIYAQSRDLRQVTHVVLDEVHYLEDPARGPVWEEIIIHLPGHVLLTALSATVSNADDLAAWIRRTRGATDVVVHTDRPVALRHLYMVGERGNPRPRIMPILKGKKPNPKGSRYDVTARHPGGGRNGKQQRRPWVTPRRAEVLAVLNEQDLLPAINFVFSRAGCDDAAASCYDAGMRFTSPQERERVAAVVEERLQHLSDADRAVLDIERWRRWLDAGIAAHHAGMIPACKEVVETLFIEGILRVVFATETLALGVNMPARAVVIERLTKFTGETHEVLTPGQYTQLTGRAGRRGLDTEGSAVVLWSPFMPFDQVAALAGSTSYVLRSAFRPTYNMVANLVATHGRDQALELVSRSFAQFQAEKAIERLEDRIDRKRRQQQDLTATLRTSIDELRAVRNLPQGDDRPLREVIDEAVAMLRPGSIVVADDGSLIAVLSVSFRKNGRINVKVVDEHADAFVLHASDFTSPPEALASIELPAPFLPNDSGFQRDVAVRLSEAVGAEVTAPLQHDEQQLHIDLRKLEQIDEIEESIGQLRSRVSSRDRSLAEQLLRVAAVLGDRHCLSEWELTPRGDMLTKVFHEHDLLLVEAIEHGVFDSLDTDEFAALLSCLTYEHRRSTPPPAPWFSTKAAETAFQRLSALAEDIRRVEKANRLPLTREPDPTMFAMVHAWSAGVNLDDVLDDDLSGGDFVRQIRLVIDLADQVFRVAKDHRAATAAERLRRGIIVSADGFEDETQSDADTEASPDAG